MSRALHLVPGARWYAGVDLPFWLPTSAVDSGAQDMGFREIAWHDREDDALPSGVDPRSDRNYSDSWDQWATGIYQGPERDHTIPWNVPWLVAVNPQIQLPPPQQVTVPELTLDQRTQELTRIALESNNPAVMRVAAQMMTAQGYPALAQQLSQRATMLDSAQAAPPVQAAPPADAPEVEVTTGTAQVLEPEPEPVAGPEPEPSTSTGGVSMKLAAGAIVLDVVGSLLFMWLFSKMRKKRHGSSRVTAAGA